MKLCMKAALAAALILELCACANQPTKTANVTLIQPLSKVEWEERIAATQAPMHVSNNNLIMMR